MADALLQLVIYSCSNSSCVTIFHSHSHIHWKKQMFSHPDGFHPFMLPISGFHVHNTLLEYVQQPILTFTFIGRICSTSNSCPPSYSCHSQWNSCWWKTLKLSCDFNSYRNDNNLFSLINNLTMNKPASYKNPKSHFLFADFQCCSAFTRESQGWEDRWVSHTFNQLTWTRRLFLSLKMQQK